MNKLSTFYDEIKNYEKNLIKPCLITKDTDSSFEVWISKGSSSIFFNSIVLFPDHLTIKFNPHIIKDTYDYIPNTSKSSYEYQVTETDIERNIDSQLKRTILDLILTSRNKG